MTSVSNNDLLTIFVVQECAKAFYGVTSQTDIGRQRVESTRVPSRLRLVRSCGDLPFHLPSIFTTMQERMEDSHSECEAIINDLLFADHPDRLRDNLKMMELLALSENDDNDIKKDIIFTYMTLDQLLKRVEGSFYYLTSKIRG